LDLRSLRRSTRTAIHQLLALRIECLGRHLALAMSDKHRHKFA
jgi:hypothetical protein